MTTQEFLAKIKQIFADAPAPIAEPIAVVDPADYVTEDGKTLHIESWDIGSPVLLDGAAAPAGDYVIGTSTVTVDDAGNISNVVDSAMPAPAVLPAVPDFSAQFETVRGEVGAIRTEFAAHTQAFTQYKTTTDAQLAHNSKVIGELIALCGQMAGEPAAVLPTPQKSPNSFSKVESKGKGLEKYAASLAKLKQK